MEVYAILILALILVAAAVLFSRKGARPLGASSSSNPSLGVVMSIRSQVHGRDWTISWDPATANSIQTNHYMINLVGPKPDNNSSITNHVVTGTSYSVPNYLFEGDYVFEIWPYDPSSHTIGYRNVAYVSNRP